MPQSKILVDTNVYLRLAQSIHPLLKTSFGHEKYTLCVLPDLADEYHNNPRLLGSFSWFTNDEYKSNRIYKWHLSKDEKNFIDEAFKFISAASIDISPGVSRIDVKCLAYAFVLKLPVATDDAEMIVLADEFDIRIYKMLDILKLMLDSKHIDIQKVRSIAEYLIYLPDLPKNFFEDYKRIFSEEPPAK